MNPTTDESLTTKIEHRWALARYFDRPGPLTLLGRFCFTGGHEDDLRTIKTFRTRAKARGAQATCGYKDARPVRVRVTIELIRREPSDA